MQSQTSRLPLLTSRTLASIVVFICLAPHLLVVQFILFQDMSSCDTARFSRGWRCKTDPEAGLHRPVFPSCKDTASTFAIEQVLYEALSPCDVCFSCRDRLSAGLKADFLLIKQSRHMRCMCRPKRPVFHCYTEDEAKRF